MKGGEGERTKGGGEQGMRGGEEGMKGGGKEGMKEEEDVQERCKRMETFTKLITARSGQPILPQVGPNSVGSGR